uniref:Cytochrome b561 bacterial/Ni-hydrogenase domain-containing protein n=1 Tax=Vannella robusta TaxID=1487602 RepID=A0A7S4MRW7_9EUKA
MQYVKASKQLLVRAYSTAVPAVVQYAPSLRWTHWIMGGLIVGNIGSVKLAQWTEDKEKKMQYMHIHKSLALIILAMLPIRIGLRLTTKLPKALPGNALEKLAGNLNHYALYAGMTILPISGVTMGYFGGKGLPFFSYHIKGATETQPEIAKTAFKIHKLTGQVMTYLVPLHIAAAGYHVARGHYIFHRMNPFV